MAFEKTRSARAEMDAAFERLAASCNEADIPAYLAAVTNLRAAEKADYADQHDDAYWDRFVRMMYNE